MKSFVEENREIDLLIHSVSIVDSFEADKLIIRIMHTELRLLCLGRSHCVIKG